MRSEGHFSAAMLAFHKDVDVTGPKADGGTPTQEEGAGRFRR